MNDIATDTVIMLDLGFRPEAAISGELLVASEDTAWLLFNAVHLEADGFYHYAGTGVLEFTRCQITRFGYPNDEGRSEHPRFSTMYEGYGIFEVLNSSWVAAEFGDQGAQEYRHFVVSFHESTFECIAKDFHHEVPHEPFQVALQRVSERVLAAD